MTHPTAWWPGAKNSFIDFAKTLGGKQTLDAVRADIYSRPNYIDGKYQKADIIAKSITVLKASNVAPASGTSPATSKMNNRKKIFDLSFPCVNNTPNAAINNAKVIAIQLMRD